MDRSAALAPAVSGSKFTTIRSEWRLMRANLCIGERGAAAGHHVMNARRIDTDHVHVAFHQNGVIGLAHGILGAMQVIKNVGSCDRGRSPVS